MKFGLLRMLCSEPKIDKPPRAQLPSASDRETSAVYATMIPIYPLRVRSRSADDPVPMSAVGRKADLNHGLA